MYNVEPETTPKPHKFRHSFRCSFPSRVNQCLSNATSSGASCSSLFRMVDSRVRGWRNMGSNVFLESISTSTDTKATEDRYINVAVNERHFCFAHQHGQYSLGQTQDPRSVSHRQRPLYPPELKHARQGRHCAEPEQLL